jgi:hypothetical protein
MLMVLEAVLTILELIVMVRNGFGADMDGFGVDGNEFGSVQRNMDRFARVQSRHITMVAMAILS